MKVFLSHQNADSLAALEIAGKLRSRQIEVYLDVIDPAASQAGEALGEHIRTKLQGCDSLLAVVSYATKTSWWVPWEIGVATEKSLPLATYAIDQTPLPEYLRRWPYLRSVADLDVYVASLKQADVDYIRKKVLLTEQRARKEATSDYFATVRRGLGQ